MATHIEIEVFCGGSESEVKKVVESNKLPHTFIKDGVLQSKNERLEIIQRKRILNKNQIFSIEQPSKYSSNSLLILVGGNNCRSGNHFCVTTDYEELKKQLTS